MRHLTISESIQAKAKELKVDPQFLLISLAGIHDKREPLSTLKYWYNSLCNSMKEQAESQLQSKKEKIREAGKSALSDHKLCYITEDSKSSEVSQLMFIDFTKPVYHYQLLAWLEVIDKGVFRILIKGGKDYNINLGKGVLSAYYEYLKLLCKDELHKVEQFTEVFHEQDITLN